MGLAQKDVLSTRAVRSAERREERDASQPACVPAACPQPQHPEEAGLPERGARAQRPGRSCSGLTSLKARGALGVGGVLRARMQLPDRPCRAAQASEGAEEGAPGKARAPRLLPHTAASARRGPREAGEGPDAPTAPGAGSAAQPRAANAFAGAPRQARPQLHRFRLTVPRDRGRGGTSDSPARPSGGVAPS